MISLIVATDTFGAIAIKGEDSLPWHCTSDMAYFKKITMNNVVIMGRSTWDSIPEKFRPLPNRHNIILTNDYKSIGREVGDAYEVAVSIQDALQMAEDWIHYDNRETETIIIGGVSIYDQFMELGLVDRIYINVLKLTLNKPLDDLLFFQGYQSGLKVNFIKMIEEEHEDFTSYVYESKKYTEKRIRGN